MNRRGNSFKDILFSSRALFLVSLFILVFFSFNLGKELLNRKDLEKDIGKLQAEIDSLENKNKELSGLIDYFKSLDFVENEARTKLNLRKPGEKIIIVPENEAETDISEITGFKKILEQSVAIKSNPENWWNYFFNVN